MAWKSGDRLIHRFNPDLGPGVVREVAERTLTVEFPDSGTTLRLARTSEALRPFEIRPGAPAELRPGGEPVLVEALVEPGRARLADGREVDERDLWPLGAGGSLFERLALGDIDRLEEFSLRVDALHLAALREADGLGSFLGGRIRLFPHQLRAAEQATRTDPVRWLLADEVGLGKTVEACLILNHLVRTGRAERVVVVAPGTLTVQWLGELWRKYHQVFVLLDDARLADVDKVYGPGFNPFEAHRRVVVGLEWLAARPRLTEAAVAAGVDLLIVDEAHHLRRPPGHPGDPAYRAVRPIADAGRHVVLLTATPLEEDAHGFFRLVQLLRPEEFPEDLDFAERLCRRIPLPPCTSSTRRADVGGLPPRVPRPVDLPDDGSSDARAALERAVLALPAPHAVARRDKLRRLARALSSGASLAATLRGGETEPARLARAADAHDPRLAWLVRQAPIWKTAGDKTLVFVADRETLEVIRGELGRVLQLRVGVFHEDLSPGQRDIEVAQFRLDSGPSLLVSTECGGEGRNFEFCTRLVLWDLPWNPMLVEQRIGRLDRIGRRLPVDIVYFRPPRGLSRIVAELYEELGLFREPLGGLERELSGVQAALEEAALDGGIVDPALLGRLVGEAHAARDRVREAAYHELHRDPYRAEMAPAILARVPGELEELTEDVVLAACERLRLSVEEHRAGTRHSIELGTHARVESLPGVPPRASFLGTFDREAAVRDESIDFYASGHPLVEGLLAHLEDSASGRVALLDVRSAGAEEGFGLLALFRHGPALQALALDAHGRSRPEWAERLVTRPLRSRRVRPDAWTRQPGWPGLVRTLAQHFAERGRPVAIAAFRIAPAD